MDLIYQDKLNEANKIAEHLGYESWDKMPEEERKKAIPFFGLLKRVEREFHFNLFYDIRKQLDCQKNVLSVFDNIDKLEKLSDFIDT